MYHLLAFLLPVMYECSCGYLLRAASGPPENKSITLDVGSYVGAVSLYSSNNDSTDLGASYADVIRGHRHRNKCHRVTNISKAIIDHGVKDIHFYHSNLIVAAEINRTGIYIVILSVVHR